VQGAKHSRKWKENYTTAMQKETVKGKNEGKEQQTKEDDRK
jgi:hypothetical protein